MKKSSRLFALLLVLMLAAGLCACGNSASDGTENNTSGNQEVTSGSETSGTTATTSGDTGTTAAASDSTDKTDIESALTLANKKPDRTYSETSDA